MNFKCGNLLFSLFSAVVWISAGTACASKPRVAEAIFENSAGSPLVSLIQSAKTSVDIEIYEMNDMGVHLAIQDALNRRVKVRVIKDGTPVGGSCRVFSPLSERDTVDCQAEKSLKISVQEAGGEYVAFNKENLCAAPGGKCFEHGKIVLVDRSRALLSTGNFNSTSLCSASERGDTCNRDYTVVSEDPSVVNLLETIFEKDIVGQRYDMSVILAKTGNGKVTVSPFSLEPLIRFIQTAQKSIQIQNQYLKNPQLNQAIREAASRGVEVEVMVASACSFGPPKSGDAQGWTATYRAFDLAGVKTRIFPRKIQIRGVGGYLHAKTIVVDQRRAWVGSVNGSTQSLTNNREFGIFIDEPSQVQKLSNIMYHDFVDPNGETWKESLDCKNDPRPSSGEEGN